MQHIYYNETRLENLTVSINIHVDILYCIFSPLLGIIMCYLLHRSKSSKSIIKHIQSQWIIRTYVNIDSQIKLAVVDQVGSSKVPIREDYRIS